MIFIMALRLAIFGRSDKTIHAATFLSKNLNGTVIFPKNYDVLNTSYFQTSKNVFIPVSTLKDLDKFKNQGFQALQIKELMIPPHQDKYFTYCIDYPAGKTESKKKFESNLEWLMTMFYPENKQICGLTCPCVNYDWNDSSRYSYEKYN